MKTKYWQLVPLKASVGQKLLLQFGKKESEELVKNYQLYF